MAQTNAEYRASKLVEYRPNGIGQLSQVLWISRSVSPITMPSTSHRYFSKARCQGTLRSLSPRLWSDRTI